MRAGRAFGERVVDLVKGYLARRLDPLEARIASLEARAVPVDGKAGRDGISVSNAIVDDDGILILALSDGAIKKTGRVRGRDGIDGKDGAPGAKGEKGDAGKDGASGRDGIDGKDGAPGAKGEKGDAGKDGASGRDGIDGKDGAPGAKGEKGDAGKDGASGRDGIDGKDGAPGAKGEKGDAGKDGASGRDGIDGKDGAPGAKGEKGDAGKDGASGRDGIDGKDGAPGAKGEKGEKGDNGMRGADGRDGRDGKDADMEIAVELVRGEIARQIADIPVVRGDPGLSLKDCGVYKSGQQYEAGNAVSYGGSLWLAQEPTSDKPGETKAWRLAVKKGRDGRDPDPETLRRAIAAVVRKMKDEGEL